jgi:hypothetical protein
MDGTCNTQGRNEKSIKFWSKNLKKRDYFGGLDIDKRISEMITRKHGGRARIRLIWFRTFRFHKWCKIF